MIRFVYWTISVFAFVMYGGVGFQVCLMSNSGALSYLFMEEKNRPSGN